MTTLPIVNVGYDAANYYVLGGRAPRLLVDVGWPGTLAKLRHMLQRKGISLHEPGYLLVTHYHPDHAGLAQEIQQQGLRLIVFETQVAAIPQLRQYMKPQHRYVDIDLQTAIRLGAAQSRSFFHGIGIAGEIISTPGHSADSITLILDQGAAFTGDLPPSPDMGQDPADPVNQSWACIRALGARMVYPGHGPARPL